MTFKSLREIGMWTISELVRNIISQADRQRHGTAQRHMASSRNVLSAPRLLQSSVDAEVCNVRLWANEYKEA